MYRLLAGPVVGRHKYRLLVMRAWLVLAGSISQRVRTLSARSLRRVRGRHGMRLLSCRHVQSLYGSGRPVPRVRARHLLGGGRRLALRRLRLWSLLGRGRDRVHHAATGLAHQLPSRLLCEQRRLYTVFAWHVCGRGEYHGMRRLPGRLHFSRCRGNALRRVPAGSLRSVRGRTRVPPVRAVPVLELAGRDRVCLVSAGHAHAVRRRRRDQRERVPAE